MTRKRSRLIAEGSDWTLEAIAQYDAEIGRVARNFGLDTYRHQLEHSKRVIVTTIRNQRKSFGAILSKRF